MQNFNGEACRTAAKPVDEPARTLFRTPKFGPQRTDGRLICMQMFCIQIMTKAGRNHTLRRFLIGQTKRYSAEPGEG